MIISDVKSWGVDVWDVIIKKHPNFQYNNINFIPPQLISDALVGLRILSQNVGNKNIWILFETDPEYIEFIKASMVKFKFEIITNIPKSQILFFSAEDKETVIKSLELEGYIDDKGKFLEKFQETVSCPIWFNPSKEDVDENVNKMNYKVRVVSGWRQLLEIF